MSFQSLRSTLETKVNDRNNKKNDLNEKREALKLLQEQVNANKAAGINPTQGELTNIQTLQSDIATFESDLATLQGDVDTAQASLVSFSPSIKTLITNLNDLYPILLFPVRIETRFEYIEGDPDPYQLWVRVFPDDIEIESHDPYLTIAEEAAGMDFWDKVGAAGATQQDKYTAWEGLCKRMTRERAAFVAVNTVGVTTPQATRVSPWRIHPEIFVFPDKFIISLYNNNTLELEHEGNRIPDSIKVGYDPVSGDSVSKTTSNLSYNSDVQWIYDFDNAVANGLGFKVLLSQQQYNNGFERMVVVGVKVSRDHLQGKDIVESLINSHHFTDGFSLLRQGTNTNNTENKYSGYTKVEFDNKDAYTVELVNSPAQITVTQVEQNKQDGQILAEALGIDIPVFQHIFHAGGRDLVNAINMNTALSSATVVYAQDTLLQQLEAEYREKARAFFNDYITARGALPSIRSGEQPYGILPITLTSKMTWNVDDPDKDFYQAFLSDINRQEGHWLTASENLVHAGRTDLAPEKIWADIHSRGGVSARFQYRLAMGPEYMWNYYMLQGDEQGANDWYEDMQSKKAAIRSDLDFGPEDHDFPAMDLTFSEKSVPITTPAVDIYPDSETRKLATVPGTEMNYIELLLESSFEQLRTEDYGQDGDKPDTLLYKVMRQSLLEEHFRVVAGLLDLSEEERKIQEFTNILEHPGSGGSIPDYTDETKWTKTYCNPWIIMLSNLVSLCPIDTGSNGSISEMHQKMLQLISLLNSNGYDELENWIDSQEYCEAGEALMNFFLNMSGTGIAMPSGLSDNLGNKFEEMLNIYDTISSEFADMEENMVEPTIRGRSRWDYFYEEIPGIGQTYADLHDSGDLFVAGEVGGTDNLIGMRAAMSELTDLPTAELSLLFREHMDLCNSRFDAWKMALYNERLKAMRRDSSSPDGYRRGIYVGAYSWLENIKKGPDRVEVESPDTDEFPEPLYDDAGNHGFILAPSIGQAVTGAIIRSGYIGSNGTKLAVNLTSGRIRVALGIIEGLNNNQRIEALLGYIFERGLHEKQNPSEPDMNKFIKTIRDKFPISSTYEVPSSEPSESVRARNVVNGLGLVEHYRNNPTTFLRPTATPPITLNPAPANSTEWSIIERNLDAIADAFDAANDLLMAEGAFQIVNGNADKAAALTRNVASGKNIPIPEIINTQSSGTDQTNRVMMHFSPIYPVYPVFPNTNQSPDLGKNIRAKLETTVETFLSDYFGNLTDYRCKASFIEDSPVTDIIVKLSDLNLSYSDLVNLAGKDPFTQDSEMARRVKIVARNTTSSVKYGMIVVHFDDPGSNLYKTFAQFQAIGDIMARFLKSIKPLRPSDFTDPQTRSTYVDNFDATNISDRYRFLKDDIVELIADLGAALSGFTTSSPIIDFYTLRDVLAEASIFEFKRVVFDYEDQPTEDDYKKLLANADEMLTLLNTKLTKFETTGNNPATTHTYDRLVKESTLFFGENFKVLPLFDYDAQQQQVFSNQYNTVSGAATHSLLNDTGLSIPSSMSIEQYMEEWLQGVGMVRNTIGLLEELRVLRPLINSTVPTDDPFEFKALQYPFGPTFADERLMGAKHDMDKRQSNRTSFAMNMFGSFFGNPSPSPLKAGFMVDEWVESIPDPEQNAAVAFHFNAPIAKAPQCLLLAMSPDFNGSWDWNDLRDMVNDVLTTAKIRAVDYEEIAKLKAKILSLRSGFTHSLDPSNIAIGTP